MNNPSKERCPYTFKLKNRTPRDTFTILVDSREQTPWNFSSETDCERATLSTGDYSIKGLEDYIAIERKVLEDFIGCCGKQRDRFKKELERMRGYWVKAVVIEGTMHQIVNAKYRSRINPSCVIGAMASWTARYGIPFILAGDRQQAEKFSLTLMKNFHRQMTDLVKTTNINPKVA